MNQNANNQNDSTFKSDSHNKIYVKKNNEKNVNLNLKCYNEYKNRIIPSSHLKALTSLQYYTLNNNKENQYYTKICLKNKSLINSLIYGKNDLKKNLNSSEAKKTHYKQSLCRGSPDNALYTKYDKYFNSINESSSDQMKHEKKNNSNSSLDNEINQEFKKDNNTARNSINNKDKIDQIIINNLNIERENKKTL